MAPTIADDAASPVYEQVRRWPRHKIDVPVRAIIHKPDRTLILDGRGMEMSEGGVCLLIDAELGLGDKIETGVHPSIFRQTHSRAERSVQSHRIPLRSQVYS
jgi:hypothetical protein